MNKRILIIVAAVIVVLGLLVGAYFFFFAGKTPSLSTSPTPTFTSAGDQTPTQTAASGPIQGAGTVVAPRLIRIAAGPVAKGAVALSIPAQLAGSTTEAVLPDTEVRYIERASGNVYAFLVHDRVLTRIGNKTLPGALEATWLPDGSRAFVRYLSSEGGTEQISTYALSANGADGYFLPANLSSLGVIDQSTIFTLLSNANGSVASIAPLSGSVSSTLFNSPLSSITLAPLGKDFVATTKAASSIEGYAFLVSGKTGSFSRILGPHTGLSTLPSPKGDRVLFSYVYKGKLFTSVISMSARTITPLPVTTLAEKCAWSTDGNTIYCGVPTAVTKDLPDSWYQGVDTFSDRLWKIDLATRLATLITDPTTISGVRIDMVSLTLDALDDVVVFTNKIDNSIWAYDL